MTYQVLALKWRPQVFEDLVGQETVARTLTSAIQKDRIANAFLFSGVRGVGKTTTARILAKALNCESGPTIRPCGSCAACQEIAAGSSLDVMEIDGASNNGVEQVREIIEGSRYAASRDRFKIYIIDEVHMLTTSAFNALLKTLEEPPPSVKFIFATTELHKIPDTILSRCQEFEFRTVPQERIADHLKHIAQSEGIQISERALGQVARAAEGSLRDGLSALDQVIAACGDSIEETDVTELLGLIEHDVLIDAVDAIVHRDTKSILEIVDSLVRSGRDLRHFTSGLLQCFRDVLVLQVAPQTTALVAYAEDQERLAELAKELSEEDLIRSLDVLTGVESSLRWSPEPRFHLELALMKLAQLRRLASFEELVSRFERLVDGGDGGAGSGGGAGGSMGGGRASRSSARPVSSRASGGAGRSGQAVQSGQAGQAGQSGQAGQAGQAGQSGQAGQARAGGSAYRRSRNEKTTPDPRSKPDESASATGKSAEASGRSTEESSTNIPGERAEAGRSMASMEHDEPPPAFEGLGELTTERPAGADAGSVGSESSSAEKPTGETPELVEALMDALRARKPMLRALVSRHHHVTLAGEVLEVSFSSSESLIVDQLNGRDNLRIVEEELCRVAGRKLRLQPILREVEAKTEGRSEVSESGGGARPARANAAPEAPPEHARGSAGDETRTARPSANTGNGVSSQSSSGASPRDESLGAASEGEKQRALDDPLVRRFVDTFKADVEDVRVRPADSGGEAEDGRESSSS